MQSVIDDVLMEYAGAVTRLERGRIALMLYNEVMGLGPIEELLNDPGVSEIMVNGPNQVFVERNGKLHLSNVTFRDNEALMQVIEKIVAGIGRHVDE